MRDERHHGVTQAPSGAPRPRDGHRGPADFPEAPQAPLRAAHGEARAVTVART